MLHEFSDSSTDALRFTSEFFKHLDELVTTSWDHSITENVLTELAGRLLVLFLCTFSFTVNIHILLWFFLGLNIQKLSLSLNQLKIPLRKVKSFYYF